MASKRDYYEILGVPRTANEKELKAAYRKLARKYHPDVNPGDKTAESSFKEVSEAFGVLSDPEKRAKYDQVGHEAFGAGFDPSRGVKIDFEDLGLGDLSDLFDLFGWGGGARGRGPRRRPAKGSDVEFEMSLPFADAIHGTTMELRLPHLRESTRVRIPPGIEDGGRIRIPGKGQPSPGGHPGDAYVNVRVEPHPLFTRDGSDLEVSVPVGIATATLGGEVEVPTLDGRTTIRIPPGTRSGQKLRLKGRGVPSRSGHPAGHLNAVVQIVPPRSIDTRSRELLEEFARLNPGA